MDLRKIRLTAITAIASDDVLYEILVLKGGNALDLVYHLGARTSLDLDFSMDGDFPDLPDARTRIESALIRRFDAEGYHAFDVKLLAKPSVPRIGQPTWGGYQASFKIISHALKRKLNGDLDSMRKQAEDMGQSQRTFTIDISKHEYCAPKQIHNIDSFTVYVYTPAMIAAEKFRALCQQLEGYALKSPARARARDFYDIHTCLTLGGVDLQTSAGHDLIRQVFAAKEVPLHLLSEIVGTRQFHEVDWPSVANSIPAGSSLDFGSYFDFVVTEIVKLETLWKVEAP